MDECNLSINLPFLGFLLSGQDKRRGGWSGCLNRSSMLRKDVKWNESFARKCSANYYFIQKERRFDKAATIIWNKIAPPRARNSHREHQRRLAADERDIIIQQHTQCRLSLQFSAGAFFQLSSVGAADSWPGSRVNRPLTPQFNEASTAIRLLVIGPLASQVNSAQFNSISRVGRSFLPVCQTWRVWTARIYTTPTNPFSSKLSSSFLPLFFSVCV